MPYYDARPRYTPGSPGVVDGEMAARVAAQEREAYEDALAGRHGLQEQAKAKEQGLGGIVLNMQEGAAHWIVFDLLTEQHWRWPFRARCPDCGAQVDCKRGHIADHYEKRPGRRTRGVEMCDGGGKFVGRLVE